MILNPVAPFISDLIQAANNIDQLRGFERARLLRRAALTIVDYRDQIDFSETPANDTGPGDIVFDLNSMASLIEAFPAKEIAAMMLKAVEVIKAARVLLDEKRKIQSETDGSA